MEFASGEKTSAGRRCALRGVQFAGGPPPPHKAVLAGRRCALCGVQFAGGPPPPPKAVSGGREAGHDAGRDVGREAGRDVGRDVGRETGREAGGIEWLRCPDCGLRFWADPAGGADGRCAVGLVLEDAP